MNATMEKDVRAVTKSCTKCGKEKPLSEFCKEKGGKDGIRSHCKVCRNKYHKKHQLENKAEIDLRHKKHQLENPIEKKVCHSCKIEKDIREFIKCKDYKDGLSYKCKSCLKESNDKNKERLFQEHLKYQSENPVKKKVCLGCKLKKDVVEFCKNKRSKDGFSCRCKTCCSKNYGQWHSKNSEHKKQHDKQYRLDNPEKNERNFTKTLFKI